MSDGIRESDEPASRRCIEHGCDEPAGTPWTPFWCARHDTLRRDRISRQLASLLDKEEQG